MMEILQAIVVGVLIAGVLTGIAVITAGSGCPELSDDDYEDSQDYTDRRHRRY
jgi:hypothetical protein